jgi:hypothetical protein
VFLPLAGIRRKRDRTGKWSEDAGATVFDGMAAFSADVLDNGAD